MLFLHPDVIGKGVGRELMQFAINQLHVNTVDVNEENIHAVRFYEKAGFSIVQRKDFDDFGKPHPILTMRL
jgi:putative acetyltransferase